MGVSYERGTPVGLRVRDSLVGRATERKRERARARDKKRDGKRDRDIEGDRQRGRDREGDSHTDRQKHRVYLSV